MKKCFMPRKKLEKKYTRTFIFIVLSQQYHTRSLNFECSIIPGKTSKETIKLRPKHSTMKFCYNEKFRIYLEE